MSKPKQATLFQSWGSKSQGQKGEKKDNDPTKHEKQPKTPSDWEQPEDTIDLLDSEDESDQELAEALEASLAEHQSACNTETGLQSGMQSHRDGVGNISFGIEDQDVEHGVDRDHCLSQWKASDVPVGDLQGYDQSAGKLWIYPTNYSVREYQFSIVRQALLKNTLVTLPTGLGKTFIAAVVMYNYYRWYPEGKVVFMAPTKPLVAQQIEACYNIMGIPRQDTAEMTGSMNPTDRQRAWQDRRVFFLTPQVMTNDLSRGSCMAEAIKCLVVDEAHKALGNHAYCQVVRELVKYSRQFRILALSATPGSDIKSIQKVVSNLLICHIELRLEESPDIKPYTHHRTVDKIVVPLGEELSHIKLQYTQVLQVVMRRLIQQHVLYNREVTSLSKFLILKARDAFRQNPPESMPRSQFGSVEGDFALAMSLYHGFELLQLHGLRSLYNFLEGIVNGTKAYGRTRSELLRNADFNDIMELLSKKFKTSGQSEDKPSLMVSHPKLVKLEEVVLEHFRRFQEAGQATRVMIFSQYRDSVQEITSLLQQFHPLVTVMSFIGQSSVGKATKGFTQKEQLKVMQAFRTGGYNTLVSTCVGEEGLDIGEVDLIVCFDAHKSPIRLVQRMGRTGRKRQGRIVMLMTEGKEEQIYNHSQYTKRSIHRAILNGARSLVFYASNPRMIPADVTPACHRMHITVQPPQPAAGQAARASRPRGRGTAPKKVDSGCEGVICVEQFAELKSKGYPVTVPSLPRPTMVSLISSEQGEGDEGPGSVLSLAEWLPWQNGLQQTSTLVAHSRRSRHLVELLEFTELQQALPPEEDNYGQEMNMYLDMGDVMDPRRPVSNDITQYVRPTTRHQARSREQEAEDPEAQARKRDVAKKKSEGTTRKKQKRVVQNFEPSEYSDDSDFLPEVDLLNAAGLNRGDRSDTTRPDRDVGEDQPFESEEDVEQGGEAEAVVSPCDFVDSMSPVDAEEDNASDSEVAAAAVCAEVSGRVPAFPGRLPTPPPVEDISRLLSLIRAEDWLSVDVDNIAVDSSPFPDPIPTWWTGPLEMPAAAAGQKSPFNDKRDSVDEDGGSFFINYSMQAWDVREIEVDHEARAVYAVDEINAELSVEVVQGKVKEVPSNIQDSKEVADALGSTQTNTSKIVTQFEHGASFDSNYSAEKNMCGFEGHTSGAKNEEQTVAAVTKEGGDRWQQTVAAISKEGGDRSQQTVAAVSKEGGDRSQQTVAAISKEGGDRSQQTVAAVTKEGGDRWQQTVAAVSKEGGDRSQQTVAAVTKQGGDRSQQTVAADSSPGKHDKQPHTEGKTTPAARHKSFYDTSASDSFFHKNFFEDDDGEFELTETPTTNTGNRAEAGDVSRRAGQTDCSRVRAQDTDPAVVAATSSLPTPSAASPVSEAVNVSTNSSMLTFTQALSFVHNRSASDSCHYSEPFKPSTERAQNVGQENAHKASAEMTTAQTLTSSDQEEDVPVKHEDEDSPNFDLGFDFDEDIIPPSPEADALSVSQLTGKSVSCASRVAQVSANERNQHPAANTHGFEDYAILLDAFEEDVEQDSPCFSSSFPPKQLENVETRKGLSAETSSANIASKSSAVSDDFLEVETVTANVCQSGTVSDDFPEVDLPKIGKRKLAQSSTNEAAPRTAGVGSKEAAPRTAGVGSKEAAPRTAGVGSKEAAPRTAGVGSKEAAPRTAGVGSKEAAPRTAGVGSKEAAPRTAGVGSKEAAPRTAGVGSKEAAPRTAGVGSKEAAPRTAGVGSKEAAPRTAGVGSKEAAPRTAGVGSKEAAPRTAGVGSKEAASERSRLEADCWDESESSHVAATEKAPQVKGRKSLSLREKDPSPGSSTKNVPRAQPQLKLSSIGTSSSKEDVSFAGLHDAVPQFDLLSDDNDFDVDLDPKMLFTNVSPLERSPTSREKKGTAVLCSTPMRSPQGESLSPSQRSPASREKKGTAVLCSTPMRSPQGKSLSPSQLNLQGAVSTSPLELEDDDLDESVLALKKYKRARLLSPDTTVERSDYDDFEEGVIVPRRPKRVRLLSPDSAGNEGNDERKLPSKKKHKVKKHGCGFLDDEAELSDDVAVSSDEDEENAELLEGSFIDNCTQMTQASQIDMQAVYMKSVRSPDDDGVEGHQRAGRYRLQFNPEAPGTDVYSQLPSHLEEESQYQEDSFCVGSEEESAYDNSEEEGEGGDGGLREGRAAVSKRKKRQAVQQVEGRKRVRQLVASSSDEDESFHRLPASQAVLSHAKRVKALLSSSDEQLDISAAEIFASPPKGKTNDADRDGYLRCLSPPVPQSGNLRSSQGFSVNRPHRTEGLEGVGSFPKPSKTGDRNVSGTVESKPWQKKSLSKSSVHGSSKTCTAGEKAAAQSSAQSRTSCHGSSKTCTAGEKAAAQSSAQSRTSCHESSKTGTAGEKAAAQSSEQSRTSCHGSSKTGTAGEKAAAQSSAQSRTSRLESVKARSTPKPSPNLVRAIANMPSPVSSSSVRQGDIFNTLVEEIGRSDYVPDEMVRLQKGAPGGLGYGGDGEQQKGATPLSHQSEDCSNTSASFTSIVPRKRVKMVILVDSREISGAQDIVSALRLTHNCHVCTRQLAACDYVLSNRLAVDRITLSNFSNGSNRSRLLERLQQMQSLYDRCIIIVEKDRVKPGEEKQKKSLHHTKYVDTLIAQLCQTLIRLFFTDNQNETASLLAKLTTVECRKGMDITAPVDLSPAQEQMVRYYLSLPRLCITHALNLRFNFTTIRDFIQSSVNGVQTKGHMSFSRATELVNHVRRRFSQALCSSK